MLTREATFDTDMKALWEAGALQRSKRKTPHPVRQCGAGFGLLMVIFRFKHSGLPFRPQTRNQVG